MSTYFGKDHKRLQKSTSKAWEDARGMFEEKNRIVERKPASACDCGHSKYHHAIPDNSRNVVEILSCSQCACRCYTKTHSLVQDDAQRAPVVENLSKQEPEQLDPARGVELPPEISIDDIPF